MKKHVIVLGLLFFNVVTFAQTNIFPASGNVGVGTASPLVKFDVRSTAVPGPNPDNLAFFGTYSNFQGVVNTRGIYVQYKSVGFPSSISSVLQYNLGDPSVAASKKGFIEFNKPATANTTISAISFGSTDVEFMRINQNGKVRIGNGSNDLKTPDGYKLFVEEGILTEKLKVSVKNGSNWADYVFKEEYDLMPLDEVEAFVKENNHLPNIPSATEMVENGLDVAEMDAKLLEKVEELTLYIIEQNKKNEEQNAKLEEQSKQIEELKSLVNTLMEKK